MSCKRKIGLHLRTKNNIAAILSQAEKHKLDLFQYFLTDSVTQDYYTIQHTDRDRFLKYKEQNAAEFYVHSSYKINPASGDSKILQSSEKSLKKELNAAQFIGAKGLIIHPGCAKGHPVSPKDPLGKNAGLITLAKILNNLLTEKKDLEILLENTAHANRSIGSDLTDFPRLMEKIKNPEKIYFCLDLAHAFAYGYDLNKLDNFIELIDKNMGLSNIKLLHLSDTMAPLGSKIDKHEIPGKGRIGEKALSTLINHPTLKNIPIIIELPIKVQEMRLSKILSMVKHWHTSDISI